MSKLLRIIGYLILFIVIVLVIAAIGIFVRSNQILNQTYSVEVSSFELPEANDEVLEEGRRIFVSRGCVDCHTEDGGGDPEFINDSMLGHVGSANLTRGVGGVGDEFGVEDYIRAIQHGVGPDGQALVVMPAQDWQKMRAEELGPLLVYVMAFEPVDREIPEPSLGPLGRVLFATGQIEMAADVIDHETAGLVEMDAAPTVEYGQLLAFSCKSCHGENYAGGTIPGSSIIALNITPHADGIGAWSLEDFMTALREGKRPDGSGISTDMPWQVFGEMTDVEIEAIYVYLQSIEPVEGN